MKITRRSFVKKSSYSAAAVTVLGAGVALAHAGTASNPLKWQSFEIAILVQSQITFTSSQQLTMPADEADMLQLLIPDMIDPNNINNFTKTRPGIVSVKEDHDHGGTTDIPDITQIIGQFPQYTMPPQGILNAQTGLYEFSVVISHHTPKFKILTTFRQ